MQILKNKSFVLTAVQQMQSEKCINFTMPQTGTQR